MITNRNESAFKLMQMIYKTECRRITVHNGAYPDRLVLHLQVAIRWWLWWHRLQTWPRCLYLQETVGNVGKEFDEDV